jgi:hypothetical protein
MDRLAPLEAVKPCERCGRTAPESQLNLTGTGYRCSACQIDAQLTEMKRSRNSFPSLLRALLIVLAGGVVFYVAMFFWLMFHAHG